MIDPARPSAPRPRASVSALPGYVAGRRATSAETAPLASNESHEPPLPGVLEAIVEHAGRVTRYPDMAAVRLREALAGRVGLGVDAVAVGAGSVSVLQQVLTAFCEAGDDVVFAWRSFEAYPILTALAGATAVRVPLLSDERHDLAGMLAAITDRTRVVLLCSPNNPTGTALTSAEVSDFVARVPSGVLVVLDEAYLEYTPDPLGRASLALLADHPNLCLLRTLSKAWGLAGLRVGYGLAHPPVAEALRRTAIPFGVSSLAQAAASAALAAADEMAERAGRVVTERHRVTAALRAAGWQVPDSEGNFVWLRADGERYAALMAAFDQADILVRGFADDGIRITLADPATNDRVLAVLADRAPFGVQR